VCVNIFFASTGFKVTIDNISPFGITKTIHRSNFSFIIPPGIYFARRSSHLVLYTNNKILLIII
jgi:hypothetical protein